VTIDHIDRIAWLRDEISRLEEELEVLGGPSAEADPVSDMNALFSHMDRVRVTDQLQRAHKELDHITVGSLRLRLTGPAVHGSSIEADVLGDLLRDLDALAQSQDGDLLIGVPSPGSHVVEVLPPAQRQIFDDAFVTTTRLLVGVFEAAHRGPSTVVKVADLASEGDAASVDALTRLVGHLVDHRVNVTLDSEAAGEHRTVALRGPEANDLLKALKDVIEDTRPRAVVGTFGGALQGSLRFEIETADGETLRGRVPVKVRRQLIGLRIGTQVRAVIDEIHTRRTAGPESSDRVRLRLRSIRPADEADDADPQATLL
jgi:hypothetical protein